MARQRITRNCKVCGGLFSPLSSEVRRGRGLYCRWQCYRNWRAAPLAERFKRFLSAPTASGCILWTGAILPPPNCYGTIAQGGSVKRSLYAHRVSLELSGVEIPEGLEALHHCDVKFCVNPEHLYVGTALDNARDRAARDRTAKGERNAAAKLTAPTVLEIRIRFSMGNVTQKSLAREYQIGTTQMCAIINRKSWRHI